MSARTNTQQTASRLAVLLCSFLSVPGACMANDDAPQPVLVWQQLPALSDPVGFAGAFAGVSGDVLLVGGGANFPERLQWEGGQKKWYDTVFALDDPHGTWRAAGTLPRPLGYGVSLTTRDGVVCIGGGDAERHYRDVFRLEWREDRLHVVPLPDLPRPCAFASGALLGDTIYLAGGIETPGATTAMKTFWALDLTRLDAGWQDLEPWPGAERMLAVPAVQNGAFYLFSGTRLDAGADRKPVREYLRDAYRYRPGRGWDRIADVPVAVVAAPSPAPSVNGRVLVLGGDDGTKVHFRPLAQHPGFPRTVHAYDPDGNSWSAVDEVPFSRATVPLVPWRGLWVLCNGESRPGVRSPEIWAAEAARPARGFGVLDYVLGGSFLLLLALCGPALWRGERTSGVGFGRGYAWLLVGLLWVVAVFNYLDRQVLFSVFPLLRDDLHLSMFQLGLLSTVFLWVYGVLSPFAGYLADRFGRRRVILASLLVWSVVTWATGHARSFNDLLWARGLMGLSEACYLPAALALIAAAHPRNSRSLATGLHQSGLYVGVVLGGVGGGWLGELYGWRFAFTLLGLAGVLYMMVLTFMLKENGTDAAAPKVDDIQPRFGTALRELAALPGFGTMALVFGAVGIANWVVYTWLPFYLYDRFHMSLTAAGFSATFYLQAASLVGIVAGGWLADRWSEANSRGRVLTQTIGLLTAAVFLFLLGVAGATPLLIVSLVLFGLGKGLYDCNTMPVLCQVARPNLRSTGYGVFNLVGCVAGGAVAAAAGALKERVGLVIVFQGAALLLLVSALAIWFLPVRRTVGDTPSPLAFNLRVTGDAQ